MIIIIIYIVKKNYTAIASNLKKDYPQPSLNKKTLQKQGFGGQISEIEAFRSPANKL